MKETGPKRARSIAFNLYTTGKFKLFCSNRKHISNCLKIKRGQYRKSWRNTMKNWKVGDMFTTSTQKFLNIQWDNQCILNKLNSGSFRFTGKKMQRQGKEFPCYSHPVSPIINIFNLYDKFVTINEPMTIPWN